MIKPWEVSYQEMRKFGLNKHQMKNMDRLTKAQYKNNAWHEAAHAVVGDAVGMNPDFIDLTPRISEVNGGCVMLTAAQTRQRQPTRLESIAALNGDVNAIGLIERHLVAGMAGVVFDLQNGQFGGGMDLWDMISRCVNLYRGDTDKCAIVLRKSAIEAATILEDRSSILRALATKAMKLQMLDKNDIDSVLKLELHNKPMDFVKHADINLLFAVKSGIDPRCQIGLICSEPVFDYTTVASEPPYDVFVKLDETMVKEIVTRFEVA
jgi:hypothetical protein